MKRMIFTGKSGWVRPPSSLPFPVSWLDMDTSFGDRLRSEHETGHVSGNSAIRGCHRRSKIAQ